LLHGAHLQAEKLGCDGRIEEAQGVLKLCDQLKDERTALQEVVVLTFNHLIVTSVCASLGHVLSLYLCKNLFSLQAQCLQVCRLVTAVMIW